MSDPKMLDRLLSEIRANTWTGPDELGPEWQEAMSEAIESGALHITIDGIFFLRNPDGTYDLKKKI